MAALQKAIKKYESLLEEAALVYPRKVAELKEYMAEKHPEWTPEQMDVYILEQTKGSWMEYKNHFEEEYKTYLREDVGCRKFNNKSFYDGITYHLRYWIEDSTLIPLEDI
jgi:hypothetical protein